MSCRYLPGTVLTEIERYGRVRAVRPEASPDAVRSTSVPASQLRDRRELRTASLLALVDEGGWTLREDGTDHRVMVKNDPRLGVVGAHLVPLYALDAIRTRITKRQ